MDTQPIKVILIEDKPDDARLVKHMLTQDWSVSFDLSIESSLAAGLDYLTRQKVDAILLDLSLPDSQGLEALIRIRQAAPSVATIVLTGFEDYPLGVEAVNSGAQHCLIKGQLDGELLKRSIHYSVERAHSAQSLLQSERMLRSVITQAAEGIILIDEEGLIIEWNAAQEQITGLPGSDVIGRSIWEVQYRLALDARKTPAHLTHLKEITQEFLQTGRPSWSSPMPQQVLVRPDGSQRIIQTSISAIKTERGYMASSITRDISSQMLVQQALEDMNLFLQRSLDALAVHIAILDETGTIIAVNRAWRQFADDNDLNDPTYGIGTNYLRLCESASGPWAEEAQTVAAGIRVALAADTAEFSLEYPCHSPEKQRWFNMHLRGFNVNRYRRVITVHFDITERVLAQEALVTERNLLSAMVNHLPDSIFAKSRDGRFFFNNAAAARSLGASTPESLIGKNDLDYYPPELAARFQADDQMIFQLGQPLINRLEPNIAANGEQRWMLTTKVPLRDSSGEINGLVGISRDITEHRRAQAQIDALYSEVNALYSISKQLGQSLDLETIYATLQDAIAGQMDCDSLFILSCSPEDNLIHCEWAWEDGKRIDTDSFPPIPLAADGKGNQSVVIRTGEALNIPDYQASLSASQSLNGVRSDGNTASHEPALEAEMLPQSSLIVPMKLEHRVLGIIQVFSYRPEAYSEEQLRFLKALSALAAAAVANASLYQQVQREMKERERAEAALRELNEILEQRIAAQTAELSESEARYRAIVEDQTELVCRHLPDTTLTFANNAYCQFYGIQPETALGHSFRARIYEEDRPRWEREHAALSPDNPVVTIEHRTIAGDGKLHWFQWTNRLITRVGDGLTEIQGVGRDITREKQSEQALRQAFMHEMEVNEIRSRFISMASHDLRTPLAIIQAWTDLSSQYGDRLSEERKRTGYDEVQRAIQDMVYLLDNILLVGRAEIGKLEFEPEPLDLKAFCQSLLTELKTAFGTSHHLILQVSGQYKGLWLDPKLLRHIISNLISNAMKYSPPDSRVVLSLDCGQAQVSLSVEDHGIGIPIEDQPHLFGMFFRASNVGSRSGTGLGLAIVRQSVELHGGSISFESRPGEGTTFFVLLPYVPLENQTGQDGLDHGEKSTSG